ncbi:hypothetical protein AXG55_12275 [Silvanigrella aquatica]|uniref:Methyltransferase domain-containing protein n=1 Tax=Silvanigrella aquatica TaxID=1915309 RepID=A0A1L4D4P6_9BACT|nr:hypothetical protein AXG55_12275 [Silvanigrella aquatica]
MSPKERFPNWVELYQENAVSNMPWFFEELDSDLKKFLQLKKINNGKFLDIGTGPGTQAVQLSQMGFDVTGTDIAESAIEKAKESYKEFKINFLQDDILNSKLQNKFDYIFDRGCFHVIAPEQRGVYVNNILKLLKSKGTLFLKCFHIDEPEREVGPWRLSEFDIQKIFNTYFHVQTMLKTTYQGNTSPLPKALFCTIIKKL